ncbi:interleukin-20 receptor subunit beta [Lissotriton helveticus]
MSHRGRLLACLLAVLAPAVLADYSAVPTPQNVSMVSINMKHWLIWSPVVSSSGNVTYSVQVQGEFERSYWNGIWSNVAECMRVKVPLCDVTEEIIGNVPYDFRVRADLGSEHSGWATLEQRFNRSTTLLTTPFLKVRAEGHHLIVELEELGPAFQFVLIYWNKDSENSSKMVRSSQTSFHLDTVEAGMEYCVKAQTYVTAIHRYSNFSSPVCIKVPGSTDSVLTIGLLSLFAFIVAIVVLPFLGWKAHQMLRYSCCPTVIMPETLAVTDSPRKLICPKSSPLEEYVDKCTVMVEVDASDELRHLYMQKTL